MGVFQRGDVIKRWQKFVREHRLDGRKLMKLSAESIGVLRSRSGQYAGKMTEEEVAVLVEAKAKLQAPRMRLDARKAAAITDGEGSAEPHVEPAWKAKLRTSNVRRRESGGLTSRDYEDMNKASHP